MDQPLLCCPNCGAMLPDIDPSEEFVRCPYCCSVSQTADLLADSDPIRIEKIRARSKAYREAMRMREETDQYVQMHKDNARVDEASRERARMAGKTAAYFGASLFFLTVALASFGEKRYGTAAVSALQTGLSCYAGILHSRLMCRQLRAKLIALLCAFLVLPWGLFFHLEAYSSADASWDSILLCEVLPEPRRFKGWIRKNEEDHMSVTMPRQNEKKFAAYIEDCRDAGFLLDPTQTDSFYQSYNDQGYRLELRFQDEDQRMRIDLRAPAELGVLQWPEEPLGSLIPKPDSDSGKLRWCHSDNFSLTVGDMSRDAYGEYVQQLQALGYDQDVSRTESLFSARNGSGVRVDVSYEGMNTLTIYLELPAGSEKPQKEE